MTNDENPERTEAESESTIGTVTEATVEADERDARKDHQADRAPTPEEEAKADEHAEVPAESAAAYRAAMERGANVKGEGQIDLSSESPVQGGAQVGE